MKKAIGLMLLSATSAVAHPGHEAPVTDGAAHWLLQGDHFLVIAGAVALVWLLLGGGMVRRLQSFVMRE